MKRIVAACVMSAFLLSLSACGGGVEMGMPADAAAPKKIDMTDKFSKMKEMAKTAKSKGAPNAPRKH